VAREKECPEYVISFTPRRRHNPIHHHPSQNHCMPSLPSTSYHSFPSFVVPRRCKCKRDSPPGVSSLGPATGRTKEGGDRDCRIAPLQVQAGLASRRVFTWLSHANNEGGRRPQLSNSTAVANNMTTSVSGGAIFMNAKDVTIECDVEWHTRGRY